MLLTSIQSFMKMGGYGWYVWSAYSLLIAVFLLNIVLPVKRNSKLKQRLLLQLRDE